MMNCRGAREKLGAYFDGEMPEEDVAELERHLSVCKDCAGALEELRSLHGLLMAYEPPAVDNLAPRIRAAAESGPVLIVSLRSVRIHRALARIAAGVLVVAGLAAGLLAGDAASRPLLAAAMPAREEPARLDPEFDALLADAPPGSVTDILLTSFADAEFEGGR